MKIGIIGTGVIAATLSKTMAGMKDVECYGVASRVKEDAYKFAEDHGFTKAYDSYEALAGDDEIELVYIATPHSFHYEHMKLCIEHGKNVLCEKAFTMNKKQAEDIVRLAREKKVLLAEAIWIRYMPSRKIIDDVLESGIVGKISMMTANLFYPIWQVERIIKPELAGGALLDLGVYPINFALMHFGADVERVESSVRYMSSGVDSMETITVFYRDGRIALLSDGVYGRSDRHGVFYGERGYILVDNINNPKIITVYDLEDRIIKMVEVPSQISGYEYEIQECIDSIKNGLTECPSMPLEESVFVMGIMDDLRKKWGVVYPGE